MPKRTKLRRPDADLGWSPGASDELDLLTDSEIEAVLFEEDVVKAPSPVNFSTIAGLALLGLGMFHLANTFFGTGFPAGFLNFLAIAGGTLAFLIGISGNKKKKKRKTRRRKRKVAAWKKVRESAAAKAKPLAGDLSMPPGSKPQGLYKSKKQKMIFGVCGGLAERTEIEVALIRIAFVAATLLTGGSMGPIVYIVLALSMRDPDKAY